MRQILVTISDVEEEALEGTAATENARAARAGLETDTVTLQSLVARRLAERLALDVAAHRQWQADETAAKLDALPEAERIRVKAQIADLLKGTT